MSSPDPSVSGDGSRGRPRLWIPPLHPFDAQYVEHVMGVGALADHVVVGHVPFLPMSTARLDRITSFRGFDELVTDGE